MFATSGDSVPQLDAGSQSGYLQSVRVHVANQLRFGLFIDVLNFIRISPNLRNTVYCTALRVGGATEWHFMQARFLKARSVSEKDLLMTALGCTRLPWLLIR